MESLTLNPKSPNSCSSHWYVVQSKPREEHRAEHFLRQKGFITYLPLMEISSLRGLRNIIEQKPLFPRYLFCRFNPEENLPHVRWTRGVAKILPESTCPVSVDDEVVSAIRNLEKQDGIIRKRPLKENDSIRISRGPMKDILGVFERWTSDKGRVLVLLQFVNYQASVELHHSCVERLSEISPVQR